MAGLPRGMEHISRKDLYTSLPARIHYIHQYLDFGDDDLAALLDGQPYIRAAIPDVSSMVYSKLLRHDITARVFYGRDSRLEEDPDIWPKDESSAIQTRKIFLKWYLTRLISDPTDMKYWEYLDRIGAMHAGIGRRDPIYIDYTFLGLMLGYVQNLVIETILSQPDLELKRKTAILKAFSKIIWIQNDLFARWHTRDSEDVEGPAGEVATRFESMGLQGGIQDCKMFSVVQSNLDVDSIRSKGSGKTSLGRSRDDALHRVSSTDSRCPYTPVVLDDQRVALPRTSSCTPSRAGSSASRNVEEKPKYRERADTKVHI